MMLTSLDRLMLVALFVPLFITGCEGEPQCEQDSDCLSVVPCSQVTCDAGVCTTTILDDCCGNGVCESMLENTCTCPEDCGVCQGPVSFPSATGEMVTARYLEMRCNDAEICAVWFDKEEQVYNQEFHELSLDGMTFNVLVNYPNPLEVEKEGLSIELKLLEITDPKVTYPIKVTGALALDGALVFGRNLNHGQFRGLGDSVEILIPISRLGRLPEEDYPLEAHISLEYVHLMEKQSINDGLLVYDQYGRPVMQTVRDTTARSTLVVGLGQDVTLIRLKAATMQAMAP